MITSVAQRWRERRDSYRPAGETIATHLYEVAEIRDDRTARDFVERHHYSASYPAARWRVGLYRGADLVGVAVFSQPMHEAVLKAAPGAERVELGRFVLLDDVPANGESWMLARCFELLRSHGVEGLISHSDPMPRSGTDGGVVFGGHVGTIYQALNATYLGTTPRRTLRLLESGQVVSARALSKIRSGERGWRYATEQLVRAGARPPVDGEDLRAWLTVELARVSRAVRHPGNHRYVWALDRRLRRHLPASLPYPKLCLDHERRAA